MKRLIVNADDFGLCASVNRGILEAHRDGIVTSATILANAPGFEDAAALARDGPGLGVGVHLNLTRGRPVSRPADVPSLVRGDGRFAHTPGALARGRMAMEDVRREWAAQIARVRSAGIAPTHLDSEKHVHFLPVLLAAAVGLAREHGIRAIRGGAEAGLLARLAPTNPQWYKAVALAALGRRARRRIVAAGLRAPDRLLGIIDSGRLNAGGLGRLLDGLPDGVAELICHPGYVSQELRAIVAETGGGSLLEAREREVRAFTAPAVRRMVETQRIELIHYGKL